ncbi:AAA family ATPase [Nocardia sp. NPDC049220]|uniref:LuxR C-terminal-related transcriptional regulator n=1 Tax=Nocardia sp. NPDC049220 TaxID=3155273 RepID=UPI0033F78D73
MGVNTRHRVGAGNLPTPAYGFVGRDCEQEKISGLLLGAARLITLTGPGGIGKTRLAAETVRRYTKAVRGARVYWVRMARLARNAEEAAVVGEIAHAVIDADFSGRTARAAIVDTLTTTDTTGHAGHVVLVFDNCEHLLTSVGRVVADLLETVPELTIIATSREPLGWIDELLVPVPPLTRQHALTLFQHRAELTGHPITGAEQSNTAAAICRHVHNHPLYIQLAAARLVYQPPAAILRGLTGRVDDARLRWSQTRRLGADPRHGAVTDVIDWSYNLCTDKERLLFDRLSVFAAGYYTNPDDPDTTNILLDVGADLDAIETICSDTTYDDAKADSGGDGRSAGAGLARNEIEGLLERLADHSLISAQRTSNTVRYSLMESLRVYAQHRLSLRSTPEVDEPARLAKRHIHYYRDKTVYAAAHWFTPERQDLLNWARTNWANNVTAIEASLNTPDQATAGLEICLGLAHMRVPFTNGSIREMRRWLQCCLEATRVAVPQPTEIQIAAMAVMVRLALTQGIYDDAEQLLEDCVAACIPDAEARSKWRHDAGTDIGLPADVEFAWGMELLLTRHDPASITVFTRARNKFEALGNKGNVSLSALFAATAAGLLGDAKQAHEITEQYLDHTNVSGAPRDKAWAELARSIALTRHGDPAKALELQRASLEYNLDVGDQWSGVWAVQLRNWSLAHTITESILAGEPDQNRLEALATEIAVLAGGATTLRAGLGIEIKAMGPLADEATNAINVARRVLGPDAYADAEARGSRLRPELDEVQRVALGTLGIAPESKYRPAGKIPSSRWNELSEAEKQVAVMAAAGWTNSAIAARRGKSVRTVEAQIAAILHKLTITSREDIIDYIPRDFIGQVRTETTKRLNRDGHNAKR